MLACVTREKHLSIPFISRVFPLPLDCKVLYFMKHGLVINLMYPICMSLALLDGPISLSKYERES